MIEEILNQKDYEETVKMWDAIHRQYRDRQHLEKAKAYLKNKKVKKSKIKEVLFDGLEQALQIGLVIIICGLWLIIGLAFKC